MSGKSTKKPKPEFVPRALSEIQGEYQNLTNKAGEFQYLASTYNKELTIINEALLRLSKEGALRVRLDKEAKEREENNNSESTKEVV